MSDKNGTDGAEEGRLATLTHARLRAAQGDISGARALLLDILHRNPGHKEAAKLLAEISGRSDRVRAVESEERLAPPEPADPARLHAGFRRYLSGSRRSHRARIERLEELLRRITGKRG